MNRNESHFLSPFFLDFIFIIISFNEIQVWEEVRDESNTSIDWLIAGFDNNSKTDITVLSKGHGGISGCSAQLPVNSAAFGGCRLSTGRFVTFFYADEGTPTMQKGRASMYKNGKKSNNSISKSKNETKYIFFFSF